jgi:hypothetical protein
MPAVWARPTRNAWRIILVFYAVYAGAVVAGNVLVEYPPVSAMTIGACAAYVGFLTVGAAVGALIPPVRVRLVGLVAMRTVLSVLFAATTASVLFTWWRVGSAHGGLIGVFSNAYAVRVSLIGQEASPVPTLVGYVNSLAVAGFAIALAHSVEQRRPASFALVAYFFLLVFLGDLWLFGRIGTLYAIFCVAGLFALRADIKVLTLRNAVLALALFAVLVTPRVIRRADWSGAGLLAPYEEPLPFIKRDIPAIFNEVVETAITYISAPYALDDYFRGPTANERTLGFRTVTPVFRLVSRFAGRGYANTIEANASNLPFEFNVYTVVRDFHGDFGLVGLTILPLLIGTAFGVLFRVVGTLPNAAKMLALGWLFYTPMYNAFSFGAFLIAFCFVLLMALICIEVTEPRPSMRRRLQRREPAHTQGLERLQPTASGGPPATETLRGDPTTEHARPASLNVSVIVVNYHGGEMLERCVASVLRLALANLEVVVVDNGSRPGEMARLASLPGADGRLIVVEPGENLGFARGNNAGVAAAHGSILHFLNPDTEVFPDLADAYRELDRCRTPAVWVTRIFDRGGCRVKSWYVLPLVSQHLRALLRPGSEARWYLGASVLLRRDVFERLGGWPTDYFMYAEDLDLFYRAWREGLAVRELGTAVLHDSQGTTRSVWSQQERLNRVELGYWRFSAKYGLEHEYWIMLGVFVMRHALTDWGALRRRLEAVRSVLRLRGGKRRTADPAAPVR